MYKRQAAHTAEEDTARQLALDPVVKIIDFTGSTANGDWLENNARQALVYTCLLYTSRCV